MAENAATAAAGKAADSLFGVAKKEIGYMWDCAQNVDNLKKEAEKLKLMKETVERLIRDAIYEGDNLVEGVEDWVKNANSEISNVAKFLQEEENAKKTCFNLSWCVNLCTLYDYGKRAQANTSSVVEHHNNGNVFKEKVSVPARALEHFDLWQSNNILDFRTHKVALDKIIEAISDDTKQIVGIYGFGGVGKTTLASQAAKELEHQFDKVVFVEVKHKADVAKIRKEVDKEAKRIYNGDNILIVFDDVWGEFKLEDVRIPCGVNYKNCKILLTSRSKNVCDLNAQSSICVNPLTENEARELFKSVVGEKTEFLLTELTNECGGLPLMIKAVGNYLKSKPIDIREAALAQLQIEAPMHLPMKDAFSHLRLSYNNLETEEAKSCFLLCSMFKEDGEIEVERLTHYGVGLGIFKELDSIKVARNIVMTAVDNLSSTFLLLGENKKLKMHNIVPKLALLVTSETEDKLLLMAGKGKRQWQPRPDAAKSYTKISLMENKICKLPEHELDFRLVDTFLIQENDLPSVPDEFFQGMINVKVLDMSGNKLSYLPKSLRLLTKLRMLDLSKNESLNDISILGELTELEILKLKSTGIKKIPEDIGKLIKLRLLDVESCGNLFYVAPGVISKLIYLEELHIGFLVHMESYDCLREICKLPSLKTLFLSVPRCDLIPEDFNFEELEEFRIHTATLGSWDLVKPGIKRQLRVNETSFPFTKPVKKLIQVSHAIELCRIGDLDSILPDLYQEGLDQVKSIKLQECDNVKCLVKTRDLDAQIFVSSEDDGQSKTSKKKFFSLVEEIVLEDLSSLKLLWDFPHQYICFHNLGEIRITGCSSLSSLFPISVARVLVKLRTIDISDCDSLVVLISAEDEQTGCETDDVFPILAYICLYQLPKLNCFYPGDSTIKYPPLESIKVRHCPSLKRCGSWSQDGLSSSRDPL